MTRSSQARTRWLVVVAFALGMAWVEAASVYYLRVLVDRVEPYQANPFPVQDGLALVEIVREAATLVMLATVGLLAGRTRHAQVGYTAIAFGVWDIAYYVFLRMMGPWPRSVFDWDILFLIPLPWWGPVLAPTSIALLMIVGGTLACESRMRRPETAPTRTAWGLSGLGIVLALYVFMADALGAVSSGQDVMTMPLPTVFNWPVFGVAFALMAAPVAQTLWRMRARRRHVPATRFRRAIRSS